MWSRSRPQSARASSSTGRQSHAPNRSGTGASRPSSSRSFGRRSSSSGASRKTFTRPQSARETRRPTLHNSSSLFDAHHNRPASASSHHRHTQRPLSTDSFSDAQKKSSLRPQSAPFSHRRPSSRSSSASPAPRSVFNPHRATANLKDSLDLPTSWTENSRRRESLSLIELSLAEKLRLLSESPAPPTHRELFHDYVRLYENAFEKVLNLMPRNSELLPVLHRIKHAYHRVWTLIQQEHHNSTTQPQHTPPRGDSPRQSNDTESAFTSSRGDPAHSEFSTNNHTTTTQSQHTNSPTLQTLQEQNQQLQEQLAQNSKLLQFYAKKFNESQAKEAAVQGLSEQDLLLMKLNQIELNVDSHIYNVPHAVQSHSSPQNTPSRSLAPDKNSNTPHQQNGTMGTGSSTQDSSLYANNLAPDLTRAELVAQRRELLNKELKESKDRLTEIERELQSLETDDFFQNLGLQEGDEISFDDVSQEKSLKERLLQQVSRSKKKHSSGIEISRGTQVNRNYGSVKRTPSHNSKSRFSFDQQLQLS